MAVVNKKIIFESVTISFNENEFAYLCTILARTGGSPDRSLRGASQSIIDSLQEADINYYGFARQEEIDHSTGGKGSIYFRDVPGKY
jgi:hypothetical protein